MKNEQLGNQERGWQDSPYWSDKGQPKEQFDIAFGERRIDVANFSDVVLTEDQLFSLGKVISGFTQIKNGECFDKIRSILIDDVQPFDPETKAGVNGMGVEKDDGIIKLYPRALEPISHRVEGVSNFEGTLVHEFTHALVGKEISNEWKRRFGWKVNQKKWDKIKRLGLIEELNATPQKDWGNLHPDIFNLVRVWETDEPQRCVTDYAKLGPEDDIAESMVAAVCNPEVLDKRRLFFLQDKFLSDIDEETAPAVDIQKRFQG